MENWLKEAAKLKHFNANTQTKISCILMLITNYVCSPLLTKLSTTQFVLSSNKQCFQVLRIKKQIYFNPSFFLFVLHWTPGVDHTFAYCLDFFSPRLLFLLGQDECTCSWFNNGSCYLA